MRKKDILRKKKFISNTYMREAVDYDIVTIKEDDLFVTIKKYKKMNGTFTLSFDEGISIDYINEGYYVVELTPLKENYNIRYYLDKNKKIIDYYIDITLYNGEENKMPYYIDLYLDIIHYPKTDKIAFVDEEELKEALDNKIVSKKDYELAYRIGNKLIKEIKENKNKYMNINILEYVNRYF